MREPFYRHAPRALALVARRKRGLPANNTCASHANIAKVQAISLARWCLLRGRR